MAFVDYLYLISLLKDNKIAEATAHLKNRQLDPRKSKENFDLLAHAVPGKQTEFLEKLLKKKFQAPNSLINSQDTATGQTALHIAIGIGNTEMVYFLLQHCARHLADTAGNTPLHLACKANDILIVHLLLDAKIKADVNKINNAGKSALDYALETQPLSEQKIQMITLLIQHGATSKNALNMMSQSNDIRLLKFAAILSLNAGCEDDARQILLKRNQLDSFNVLTVEQLRDESRKKDTTNPVVNVYAFLNKYLEEATVKNAVGKILDLQNTIAYVNHIQTPANYTLLVSLSNHAVEHDALEVFRLLQECVIPESDLKKGDIKKFLFLAAKSGALKILNWFHECNKLDFLTRNDAGDNCFNAANTAARIFLFPHALEFYKRNYPVKELILWVSRVALLTIKLRDLACNFLYTEASKYNSSEYNLYLDAYEKFYPLTSLQLRFNILKSEKRWQDIYELCCKIIRDNSLSLPHYQLAEVQVNVLLNLQDGFSVSLPQKILETLPGKVITGHRVAQGMNANGNNSETAIQKFSRYVRGRKLGTNPILSIIELNEVDYFKTHVKSSADIPDEIRAQVIIATITKDRLEIFSYLHEDLKIPVLTTDEEHRSILHLAVISNAQRIFRYILAKELLSLAVATPTGVLPVGIAAAENTLHLFGEFFNEQLENPANAFDAIYNALIGNAVETLRYLWSQGVFHRLKPKRIDYIILLRGITQMDNAAALRFLLASGFAGYLATDPQEVKEAPFNALKIYDENGAFLIHFAATDNAINVMRLLHEDLQVPLTKVDSAGRSPMHYAISGKATKVRDYLAVHHAAFKIMDNEGNTPLHDAARAGDKDALEWYQSQKQLDMDVTNKTGQTILDVAADTVREFLFKVLAQAYENKTSDERISWILSTAKKSLPLKKLCVEYLWYYGNKYYATEEFVIGYVYFKELEKLAPEEAESHIELLRNLPPIAQRNHCLTIIADPQTSDDTKNKTREILIHQLICGTYFLEDRSYAKLIALYSKNFPEYDKNNSLKYALFHHLRGIQAFQILREMKKDGFPLQQIIYGYLTDQACPSRGSLTPKDFSKEAKLIYSFFYNNCNDGPIDDIYEEDLIAAIRKLAPRSTTTAKQLAAVSDLYDAKNVEKEKRKAEAAMLNDLNPDQSNPSVNKSPKTDEPDEMITSISLTQGYENSF